MPTSPNTGDDMSIGSDDVCGNPHAKSADARRMAKYFNGIIWSNLQQQKRDPEGSLSKLTLEQNYFATTIFCASLKFACITETV